MEFVPLPLARMYDHNLQNSWCILSQRLFFNYHYTHCSVIITDGLVVHSQRSSSVGPERPCVWPEAPVTPSHPQQEAAAAGWAPGGAASVA